MATSLSWLEALALLAIWRLQDDAYGVAIHAEMQTCSGRDISIPAVYSALRRLDEAGLTRPWLSETRPSRGGRARRHYSLTAAGREQLGREREAARRMWRGVPVRGDKR